MLIALKTSLHGSRRTIYENVVKANKSTLVDDDGPGEMYRATKARLFRSLETATENTGADQAVMERFAKDAEHDCSAVRGGVGAYPRELRGGRLGDPPFI